MIKLIKKMEKINYKRIRTLEDIKRRKRVLAKRARIREKIMKRRLRQIQSTATPVFIYDQFVKSIKMENSVLSVLPFLTTFIEPLKSHFFKKGNLKKTLPLIGGVGVGIAALFAFFKFKNKWNNNPKTDDENLFI
jgi:hypothetical protein